MGDPVDREGPRAPAGGGERPAEEDWDGDARVEERSGRTQAEERDESTEAPDEPRPAAQEPPKGSPLEPAQPVPGPRLVRLAFLFYGALAAAAVLWRVGWAGESILYLSEAAAQRGIDPVRDAGIGLAAGAAVVWLSHELTRRTRVARDLARALAQTLGPITIPQALVLAALSGVAEEAFFRGALQPQVGLVAASLLFGLVHFVPRRELLPWTAFSIAAGFLLGGLFELTGNLVAPVVAHFAVNAVNLPRGTREYAPPAPRGGEDAWVRSAPEPDPGPTPDRNGPDPDGG